MTACFGFILPVADGTAEKAGIAYDADFSLRFPYFGFILCFQIGGQCFSPEGLSGNSVTTIESSHKWDEGSILSSASTCLDQGEILYTCQFDSTHTKKEFFTGNHSFTHHEAASAACTENGNSEHWKCDVCGKCFSDANGETEITEATTVISLLGHDWNEWIVIKKPTASENGEAQRVCNRDDSATPRPEASISHSQR